MTDRKSRTRKDWSGEEITEHLDSDGKKVGETRRRTDAFGEDYQEHVDANGKTIGESRERTDFFGEDFQAHKNSDGQLSGASYSRKDAFGEDYIEHRDTDGAKVGETRKRADAFGENFGSTTGSLGGGLMGGAATSAAMPAIGVIGGLGALSLVLPVIGIIIVAYIAVPYLVAVGIPNWLGAQFKLPNFGRNYYVSMGGVMAVAMVLANVGEGLLSILFSALMAFVFWPIGLMVGFLLDDDPSSGTWSAIILITGSCLGVLWSVSQMKVAKGKG